MYICKISFAKQPVKCESGLYNWKLRSYFASYCYDRHQIKAEMERVCLIFILTSVHHEGEPGKELKQRLWRYTAYWYAQNFSHITHGHLLRGSTTHRELGLSHQPVIKRMPHRYAYSPVWFSQFAFHLPYGSSLCRLDKKITSTGEVRLRRQHCLPVVVTQA